MDIENGLIFDQCDQTNTNAVTERRLKGLKVTLRLLSPSVLSPQLRGTNVYYIKRRYYLPGTIT